MYSRIHSIALGICFIDTEHPVAVYEVLSEQNDRSERARMKGTVGGTRRHGKRLKQRELIFHVEKEIVFLSYRFHLDLWFP